VWPQRAVGPTTPATALPKPPRWAASSRIRCIALAYPSNLISAARENTMSRHTTLTLTSIALLCLAVALPAGNAFAQEKQHVSFKAPAENSKFTQQLNIDIGDVPNHIVRIFEVHTTFPSNAPVINGVKLVESWTRGIGDRIDGQGPATQYAVYVMENGDRFSARFDAVVQNVSGKFTSTQVGTITGGTGKFSSIHGAVLIITNFDFKGFNESQTDIDYLIGK
jgi:hypothetical protein